ncbi:MAG: hypothetical protein WAS05_08750 [Candidatus Nanopelagicales bacterium]
MTGRLKHRGRTIVLAVLTIVVFLAVYAKILGVFPGSAASLGELEVDNLGRSLGTVSTCSEDDVVLGQFTTAFVAADNKYEVRSVRFAEVPSKCVGLNFAFTGLGREAVSGQPAVVGGKVPASGGVVTFESGSGPELSSVKVTDNRIQAALVVYG